MGFAQTEHSACDRVHNEVELIIPVVRDAVEQAGIPRHEIGFTVSGSCDYLAGGPFSFVMGLDAVGAWPPIRESHVEMDAAWALYEAWVAIRTGEVDSALVYGFGKSSLGDLHEIMTLQTDPYHVAPLWPSMVDMAALQASALLAAGGTTERDLAEVAARCRRAALDNPNAVVAEAVDADELLGRPPTHPPLRDSDLPPVTDGAAAVVLAAGDLAREVCSRPAWIAGIDHRVDPQALGLRDLATAPSAASAARHAGALGADLDTAELHTQFSHEEPILCRALQLGEEVDVNPSGGPLTANPVMSTGLIRIGEIAARIHDGRIDRGLAHATQGPALQQNLVCVMEAR